MDSFPPPLTLADWRDRVAALEAVECCLIHERVRWEQGAVQRYSLGEAEPAVARFGLCRPEIRRLRIGCAHTTARYTLASALEALEAAGSLSAAEAARLQHELRDVSDAIHFLDHRKGDLEKRYALTCERCQASPAGDFPGPTVTSASPTAMRADLDTMETAHRFLVRQVAQLRGVILAKLETGIKAD